MQERLHTAGQEDFFAARTFYVTYACHGLHYEIEVHVPELSGCSKDVWADWGPMCRCTLEDQQYVEVTYHCVETGRSVRYSFHPPTIKVESPALAKTRHETPRVLNVTDLARNLVLSAYLDDEGNVARTSAKRLAPSLDVSRLVFCELDHATHAEELDTFTPALAE
jgi:hypothetical protein